MSDDESAVPLGIDASDGQIIGRAQQAQWRAPRGPDGRLPNQVALQLRTRMLDGYEVTMVATVFFGPCGPMVRREVLR